MRAHETGIAEAGASVGEGARIWHRPRQSAMRSFSPHPRELAHILNARGGRLDWRTAFDPIATPAQLRRFVTLRLISASRDAGVFEELYEIAAKEPAPG